MLKLAGRGAAGLARTALGVALAAALLAGAGVAALAWRLGEAPLNVTWLAERIERRAVPAGTEVTIGHATVAWAGFHSGLGAPLQVALSDVQVQAPGRDPAVRAGAVAVDLSMGRLLTGRLAPRSLSLTDVVLHLRRAADGTVGIDAGSAEAEGDASPTVGDVTQRPQSDSGSSTSPLAQLQRVSVHGLQVDVADQQLGAPWQARDVTIDLQRPAGGGATGTATLTLAMGDVSTHLDAAASLAEDAETTRMRITATPVNPAALARAAPALAALGALNAPVTPALTVELGQGFSLAHAALHAEAGPGTVLLPAKGGGTSPGAFASATLDVDGNRRGGTLQGLTLVLASPSGGEPSTLRAAGTLTRAGGRLHAPLTLTLDHASFADLPRLWPPGTGGGARGWLTQNITAGTAHDGQFTLTFDAAEDLSDLDLTEAGGGMVGDDLTLWWLRPVPPAEHGHAVLTLLDRDTLSIAATARQGAIQLRSGSTIRITGLSTHDQVGLIEAELASPLADMLTLLKHPKMKLLSTHAFPLNQPGGSLTGHLTVQLPLEDKVDLDSVMIHATAKITEAHLAGLVAGKNLDRGTLALDATNDGLKLSGTADLAGLPSSLAIDLDFRSGPPAQMVQHAAVSLRGTERQLAAAGVNAAGILAGTVAAHVDYSQRRDGQADIVLDAAFADAAITTPFGWSKPVGAAGSAHARALLDHGRLVGIEDLAADAPGLTVHSRTEVVNGRPAILHLQELVVGRTRATGQVHFPEREGNALEVTLTGPQLDLSGRLDAKPAAFNSDAPKRGPGKTPPSMPYRVDVRFDRVLMGGGAVIGPVSLQAENDGRKFARVSLASTGPEQVRITITPTGGGRRAVASIGDSGMLLRGLAVTQELDGGAATFDGAFDDRVPGGPLAGTFTMGSFKVRGEAWFGKLLQGVTIYGLVDALRGPGLVFDRLAAPVRLVDNVLTLKGARAFSSSLGLTAEGQVDFGRDTADLNGTIVPAYILNTLPGRIPLIGRLFSPERGGGVFAATYSVRGPLKDLSVGVNPLATLTPGVLRGLFGIFN